MTLKEEMLKDAKVKNQRQKHIICAQAAIIAALCAAVLLKHKKP